MHARLAGSSQENAANALWSMYDKADGGSGSGGTGSVRLPPTGDPERRNARMLDPDKGRMEEIPPESQPQARLLHPNDLTEEILASKPLNSPSPDKWLKGNGGISIDADGNWIYTNSDGISVRYVQSFPDFKQAGLAIRQVDVGPFRGYYKDFELAEKMIADNPIIDVVYTWHHMEDGHTLQAINRAVHRQFTHRGGMSGMRRRKND